MYISHLTNSIIHKAIGLVLVIALFGAAAPVQAVTVVDEYRPQTVQEMIAYLYGIIAQLQAELYARQGASSSDIGVAQPGSSSSDIEIETLSAADIQEDEADLRGRFDLNREDYVTVWFEYGQDRDLDERTSKHRVTDSRGDVQTFTINVDDLEEDEKYYFRAVGEGPDGDREYGDIRTFTTDENGGSSSSGDFELSVSDTQIDEGDEVEVDWEVPSRDAGARNWIGLYERDDDNEDYIQWKYIDNDTDGTVEFTINDAGTYEFRLFLDNSYDDQVTSARIEVD